MTAEQRGAGTEATADTTAHAVQLGAAVGGAPTTSASISIAGGRKQAESSEKS